MDHVRADRAYDDAGRLVARNVDGAVIADPKAIARRVTQAIVEGTIDTISGNTIHTKVHSILVHSDTPKAVDLGRSIRAAVEAAGLTVSGLSQHPGL
ncbi:LamB/YcsF family protein [Martelella sp. FLE1502]